MNKSKFKLWYFKLFKFLLIIAGLLSIKNQIWINLILVFITFFLIYFPQFLKISSKKIFPNKLEILTLLLIYIIILIETIFQVNRTLFWFRILFYLIISFVIGIVGFSLIYILNINRKSMLSLNPLFMALFSFCFSLTIGAIWQIFRYLMDYIFNISIQNFNVSDSLGFLSVHLLGATLVSFIGYIYLRNSEDKTFLKKLFRFSKLQKNIQKFEEKELLKLIKKGESEKLEFKETLRLNLHTNQYDKAINLSALKTICAFLNTKGGILLIGISDSGEIKGIEKDEFKNNDKFLLYFNNLFKKYIGNEFIPLINYEIIKIEKHSILKIISKFSDKEVFLKDGHIEEFYIRTGPASVLVEGSKLLSYVNRRFK